MQRHTKQAMLIVSGCILVGLVLVPSALATTLGDVTRACPVCDTKVTASVPRSTFISGVSDDFRPRGVGVDMTIRSFLMCPKCGFTAQYERFDKAGGLDKDKVRKALAAVKSPRLFIRLDRAVAVERAWTNNPLMLARLALAAKWVADDTGEQAVIQRRLSAAIDAHKAALTAKDLPADQKVICTYLIGELFRQAGKDKDAIKWLEKARLLGLQGRLGLLVDKQLFRVRYGAKPVASVLVAAKKGSDARKLAAVAFLRDSKDEIVIAFLKDFVLNCPKRLREAAIYALLTPEPREQHLPIFLEGLTNRHFRTVQGSARGVEAFRAAQAAPIIVEALKNPPEAADSRLFAALAATATEKELPALEKLMGSRLNQQEVYKALLNTRSKKAVPLIIKMLKSDRMYASFEKEQWADNAAAIGPDLLKALPDLKSVKDDDPLAKFKIHVLGATQTKEAREQLWDVLKRNDDLALEAALELAAKGDASGKAVLLTNIERIRSRDSVSITYVYPLLKQGDFDGLYGRMKKELAEREAHHKERKARLEKESRSKDKWEREMAQRELKRMRPFNPDWIAYQWMALLGATGNAKVCPVLMNYIDHPNTQYRAGAVKALGFVYGKTVGDAFARRLPAEDDWVRTEMIRAIGKAGDSSRLKVLMSAVEEPTLIGTKLAWIETMMRLHPAKAQPMLKKWAISPNAKLAAKAQKALATLTTGS